MSSGPFHKAKRLKEHIEKICFSLEKNPKSLGDFKIKLYLCTIKVKSKNMCRYNLNFSIDDQVVDIVRPELGSDKALEAWMIRMLKKAMSDYAHELRAQTATAVNGEELLRKLKALPNTPEGFLQLDTVLSPAKTSIEELREEAYAEKYGI